MSRSRNRAAKDSTSKINRTKTKRSNRRSPSDRKLGRSDLISYETLEPKQLLASVFYASPTTVLSLDNVIGEFAGTTYAEDSTIVDTSAVLEDPANPDGPDYDGPVRAITDKLGNTLYPTDTEFGFYVQDFLGAEDKVRDGIYAEGWVGNIYDGDGNILGLSISDAATDTFKSGSPLGTWAAGLGGNSVKASTEHYVVMQNILSDQMYPDDPDAIYQLDNNLKIVGGSDDGRFVIDVIADLQAIYDSGDTSVDVFPFAEGPVVGGDGIIDIRDVLTPNESTVTENIAAGNDYSVTLKDDGKLLYRWGQIVKRPNDVRMGVQLDLPSGWNTPDAQSLNEGKGYRVTGAELIVTHAITNNPNDQIRPEDFENEAATGRQPSYVVIEHPDHIGDSEYALWVSPVNDFAGDGTFLPSYFLLDDDGAIILDEDGNPTINTDADGNPNGTVFREVTPAGTDTSILTSSDLAGGFTNAWYTTMDRDPFEAVLNEDGEYIVGPRWRLLSNKFGQDIPGVEIPLIPHSEPPFQKGNIKYEVGELTTTTINLLDWEAGEDSPLLYSNGWIDAEDWRVNEDGVTINGLKLTDKLDVAFYVKGDSKATQLYDVRVVLTYEAETFTVTTTADSGEGSFREAIELANATAGVQSIEFAIPGTGVQTISPLTAFPTITDAVVIDATTQSGYTVSTPMIEVSGLLAGDTDGLKITADGSTIRGLVINQFNGDGIEIIAGDGNTISDNFIGTDASGEIDLGNLLFGVHVNQSANNLIDGNLLSGNDHSGAAIRGAASVNNDFTGNLVGTNAAGTTAIGNAFHGFVVVSEAEGNFIGSAVEDAGNLISGNLGVGVFLAVQSATGNSVMGNQIGTDLEGASAISNSSYGVYVANSSYNKIMDNLVSGNGLAGVVLQGIGSSENVLLENLIGTDELGTSPIPNGSFGVFVQNGASNNRIGGIAENARNVISSNGHSGVFFDGAETTDNKVFGNFIGLDATGSADLGNSQHGIVFNAGANNNRVGSTDETLGNQISGNDGSGILAALGTFENIIVGNMIGTNAVGDDAIGNTIYGIHVSSSQRNHVSDNTISGNGFNGVTIRGETAEQNYFVNNVIGRENSSDAVSLANGMHGVLFTEGAHNNNIGGVDADGGNTISFNNAGGVVAAGNGIGNAIRFNSIYSNTRLGIDLGANGFTANDAGDVDEGSNRFQNFPVLQNAALSGTSLQLAYFVNSLPANSDYPIQVDFYVADGNGQEGKEYIFSDEFTIADFTAGSKLVTTLDVDLLSGDRIVATATDGNGFLSTSEFSLSLTVA